MPEITSEFLNFLDDRIDKRISEKCEPIYRKISDCDEISKEYDVNLNGLMKYINEVKYELGTELSKVVTLLKILVGIMGCIGSAVVVILVTYLFRGIA